MNGAFYIGATALRSQQDALSVVANNIANINTPAFKRTEARFSELVSPASQSFDTALGALDISAAQGQLASAGVAMNSSARTFAQGEMRQTASPLDLAISGKGFIELMGPSGQTMLWRGGALKVDSEGFLAASNGMQLKAMISVPDAATSLTIGRDGAVTASVDGEAPSVIGQIDMVLAKDESSLSALDGGLYVAGEEEALMTAAAGTEGAGVFLQGSLESSNVQLSEEMVTMMMMQRAYAANAQVVQAADQLMSISNSLRR